MVTSGGVLTAEDAFLARHASGHLLRLLLVHLCSGSEPRAYLRRIDLLSLNSRLESN